MNQRESRFQTAVTSTTEANVHLEDTFCFAFAIPQHYGFIKAEPQKERSMYDGSL